MYRPDKAESTLNLGLGIGCDYNKAIGKGLNLTGTMELWEKKIYIYKTIVAKMPEDLKQWNESGEVMVDSQVPCLVNEKRIFLDRGRKNLDVYCLELVIGIATFVKIFSNFYTETTDIQWKAKTSELADKVKVLLQYLETFS